MTENIGWYQDASESAAATDDDAIIADLNVIEGRIGTPANTGGTATLAAILGNPSNTSLATRLAAISAYVDDLETRLTAARAGYLDYLPKIDNEATLGLLGTSNSLAYRVGEIERHFHSYERWFELAATPSAETHRADPAGTGGGSFQIDAGDSTVSPTYGAWVQILGSSDTGLRYDLHRLLVTATERNFVYVVQIAFGTSGANAYELETYTEVVFLPSSNQVDDGPVEIQTRRQAAGTKAWARCVCPGQNTATFDFRFGLHYYEG